MCINMTCIFSKNTAFQLYLVESTVSLRIDDAFRQYSSRPFTSFNLTVQMFPETPLGLASWDIRP